MKHQVSQLLLLTVAWSASAAPEYDRRPAASYGNRPTIGYDYTPPTNNYNSHSTNSYIGPDVNPYNANRLCREGEVLRADGVCQHPEVTRSVYVYHAPKAPRTYRPPPSLPKPRVHKTMLFIRTPEREEPAPPLVIPPPQHKSTIYVLDKKEEQAQRVIELPPQAQHKPDVYFVHYKDGENPILHDGTDLNSALGTAGVDLHNVEIAGYGDDVNVGGGYGVPEITLAGDSGYGGNTGHDVIVDTGYGGNHEIGYGGGPDILH